MTEEFKSVLKPSPLTKQTSESFENLYNLAKILTDEKGCPWDKQQTPLSLRWALMEEAAEAVDAITTGENSHVREELGDVLFNLVLITNCYEKQQDFTFADVMDEITEKLIRRHPHVFGELSEGKSEAEKDSSSLSKINDQWDRIKRNVEDRKTECVLDEVPAGFDPLLKCYKYLKKVSKKGFDWRNSESVLAKVYEEIEEVKDAKAELDAAGSKKEDDESVKKEAGALTASYSEKETEAYLHLEEEIGDLLMSVVKLSQSLGVDPNVALTRANKKFYNRFSYLEKEMKNQNKQMCKENDGLMLDLWQKSKSGQ